MRRLKILVDTPGRVLPLTCFELSLIPEFVRKAMRVISSAEKTPNWEEVSIEALWDEEQLILRRTKALGEQKQKLGMETGTGSGTGAGAGTGAKCNENKIAAACR